MPSDFYARLGQASYEAYVLHVGGVTWDGRPAPTWDELGEKIRGGWAAAARTALLRGLRPGGN